MVRHYKKKYEQKIKIMEETYRNALALVADNISYRQAAKQCGISEGALRYRIKNPLLKCIGAQHSIPTENEQELAHLLTVKAKWGFASTRIEVLDLVHDYVLLNKYKDTALGSYLKKHCRFKVR
jgi:hypothetical protein